MRARPGRQRILDAYVELLGERGSADFPLKLLISRADVHHTTFYNNFRDFDDVAEQLMEEFLQAARSVWEQLHGMRSVSAEVSSDVSSASISFVSEHREAFYALLASDLAGEFKQRWIQAIEDEFALYELVLYNSDGSPANLTPTELGYHIHALAYCTVAFLERWCKGGFAETPQEIIALMKRCMNLSTEKGEMRYVGLFAR